MKLQVFSIYDAVSRNYNLPFYMINVESAVRAFDNALADPEAPASKNPQDYSLFHIGEYDDDGGMLASISPERIK